MRRVLARQKVEKRQMGGGGRRKKEEERREENESLDHSGNEKVASIFHMWIVHLLYLANST